MATKKRQLVLSTRNYQLWPTHNRASLVLTKKLESSDSVVSEEKEHIHIPKKATHTTLPLPYMSTMYDL